MACLEYSRVEHIELQGQAKRPNYDPDHGRTDLRVAQLDWKAIHRLAGSSHPELRSHGGYSSIRCPGQSAHKLSGWRC